MCRRLRLGALPRWRQSTTIRGEAGEPTRPSGSAGAQHVGGVVMSVRRLYGWRCGCPSRRRDSYGGAAPARVVPAAAGAVRGGESGTAATGPAVRADLVPGRAATGRWDRPSSTTTPRNSGSTSTPSCSGPVGGRRRDPGAQPTVVDAPTATVCQCSARCTCRRLSRAAGWTALSDGQHGSGSSRELYRPDFTLTGTDDKTQYAARESRFWVGEDGDPSESGGAAGAGRSPHGSPKLAKG